MASASCKSKRLESNESVTCVTGSVHFGLTLVPCGRPVTALETDSWPLPYRVAAPSAAPELIGRPGVGGLLQHQS